MSLKTICTAIIICLACSCTNDDIVPERLSSKSELPERNNVNQQDSCANSSGGIDVGGDDFGFDNDNPPTGITTPTI